MSSDFIVGSESAKNDLISKPRLQPLYVSLGGWWGGVGGGVQSHNRVKPNSGELS